jgi:hypothetical protein
VYRLILLENGLPFFPQPVKWREAMIHHAPKILPVLEIAVAFLSIDLRTHPDTDHKQRQAFSSRLYGRFGFAEFQEKRKGLDHSRQAFRYGHTVALHFQD